RVGPALCLIWGTRWGALLCLFSPAGGRAAAFLISTPYSLCVCPEGQSVTLTCRISGALAERHDLLYKTWYFSSTGDQSCSDKRHVRNVTEKELHHDISRHHEPPGNGSQKSPLGRQGGHRGVELVPDHHGAFHIVVRNLTLQDSGNYCCYAVEVRREGHSKPHTMQVAHGFVELQVQPGEGGGPCIHGSSLPSCVADITAAALATGACIVGILCLPLILLLIYKQRQAATSRRMYQDTHAQGIENPVFEAVPSTGTEPRPRPQLSYVASRLPSESGRHLLSEPSTPLSPPGPGDCFFPTLDPVPDSPNSLKA
uniref:Ig-like domain-containing protein n=1 Tax=Catharus ustulatus TaxID=91951 RepID=A0A8C3TVK6_CATUS